jgi:1-acyl-sn-glycerol-3-phosphate acyltransferase
MEALFRLGRKMFAGYALVVFLLSLLVVVPAFFIVFLTASPGRAPHRAHGISRACAAFLLAAFGIRFRPAHTGVLDPRQTYVFIANHRSVIDIPAYAVSCRHTFRFLAKAELTRIPLLGYIIRRLYISVDRSDRAARSRSMDAMMRSLAGGISVFICPEGTRNRTGRPLLDFRDGAFRLAIAAGVPVAVLTLHGTGRLNDPRHAAELRPGRIRGRWSEPIPTAGLTEEDVPVLKARAQALMLESLAALAKEAGEPGEPAAA